MNDETKKLLESLATKSQIGQVIIGGNGYQQINFYQEKTAHSKGKAKRTPEFRDFVKDNYKDKAEVILADVKNRLDENSTPKDNVAPFRVLMDLKIMKRIPYLDFKILFPNVNIARSYYGDLTNTSSHLYNGDSYYARIKEAFEETYI